MEQVTLRAQPGRPTGSRASRRLRREGRIPAIVYGRGMDPLPISVDEHDLFGALHTEAGTNALIRLQVEGRDEILTLARVVERHPYRREYRHVDFQQVLLTETVSAEVPIHFEGEPVGVREGGVLSPARTTVHIEAVVTQIPSHVELDISGVALGDALRISDLPEIEGVTYLDDPGAVVMSVTAPAAEIVEEPEEAVLEGVEAEEAAEEAEAGEAAEDDAQEAPTEG